MARREPGAQARTTPANRRRHDRVSASVPISALHDGQPVQIEAANICEGGAYCRSEQRVPIMTRMAVRIDLPLDKDELEPPPLRVDAVVVRCEPHPFEPRVYHLALFFPSLEDNERQRLSRFVRSRRETERLATGVPGAES